MDISSLFTSSDLQLINNYLNSNLKSKKAVLRSKIFEAIVEKTESKLDKETFCTALSQCIKSGTLNGFEIVRGKFGGVRLKEASTILPATSTVLPATEDKREKPKLTAGPVLYRPFTTLGSFRYLWIRDTRYTVTMSSQEIIRLLTKVFMAKEDSGGNIVFGGNKYNCCDDSVLHRYLCYIGAPIETCEPILETTDENGIPLTLLQPIPTIDQKRW